MNRTVKNKKTLLIIALFVLVFVFIKYTNAQTISNNSADVLDSGIPKAIAVDETGASNANANISNTGAQINTQNPINQNVQSVGACVGGKLLANLLTSSISSAIKSGVGSLMGVAKGLPVTIDQTGTGRNIEADTNAHTGMFVFGVQTGVSWDSIAYCVVNTIIDYIVNSTIQWANSGFKGNPSFVRNPEQFFKQLADREAASFIQEIAYQTTGLNVCAPFRINIATGLVGSYSGLNDYARYNTCSLTQMQQNAMQSGSYTITTPTDWIALTKPQNNIYYSYISAGDELSKRIALKNNTATFDLTINRGFLSYKKCKDDSKPESKTNPCDTVTPGSVIADSLSSTLNIPRERLVSAQKFDQMVDAIVNNLIKIALSKVLEDATGKAASQPVSSDYYSTVYNQYTTPINSNTNNTQTSSKLTSSYNGSAVNGCNFDSSSYLYSVDVSKTKVDFDGTGEPPFPYDPYYYHKETSAGGLNAFTDNYLVNPMGKWSNQGGLPMRTKVYAENHTKGTTACGVVGDNGDMTSFGEVSVHMAQDLGVWIPGKDRDSVTYENDNITYKFYSK